MSLLTFGQQRHRQPIRNWDTWNMQPVCSETLAYACNFTVLQHMPLPLFLRDRLFVLNAVTILVSEQSRIHFYFEFQSSFKSWIGWLTSFRDYHVSVADRSPPYLAVIMRELHLHSHCTPSYRGRVRLKRDGTRVETRFRLSPKLTGPFKSAGASVQSTAGSRGVRISVSNAGYTTFRGSVKSTGYPLHSPVSPSLPLPCVTVCHQVSNALYHVWNH